MQRISCNPSVFQFSGYNILVLFIDLDSSHQYEFLVTSFAKYEKRLELPTLLDEHRYRKTHQYIDQTDRQDGRYLHQNEKKI